MEKEGTSLKNLLSMYGPSYTPEDPSMNVSGENDYCWVLMEKNY